MKNSRHLNLVLVCVTVLLLLFVFARAVCDDDSSNDISPCHEYVSCKDLLKIPLARNGILLEPDNDKLPLPQLIFYLARQEKSPPPAIPQTFLPS